MLPPKGVFPYSWFDSLEKLDATSLPDDIEMFRGILTEKPITKDEFQSCQDVWTVDGRTTFADFVCYYNNADVIGFVKAVDKKITNERDNNKLGLFKHSVSLPGLAQKYLFMNLSTGEYFVGFGKEHKHLTKLLRDNIVGGPSIIFHRYYGKDVTLIKGKYLCKKCYRLCCQLAVPLLPGPANANWILHPPGRQKQLQKGDALQSRIYSIAGTCNAYRRCKHPAC